MQSHLFIIIYNLKCFFLLAVALIDRQAFNVGDQISASQGFQNNFGARDAGNNQFGAQNNGFNDAQASNNFQNFGGVRADVSFLY